VELDLSFEFASSVVDVVFGRFFEEICNSLVDAFRKRADTIYGASK
jgi:ribosome-associated toxin RatA of RatAB toxin-antitoxin module